MRDDWKKNCSKQKSKDAKPSGKEAAVRAAPEYFKMMSCVSVMGAKKNGI